eukprot:2785722-Pleurochrysis_carterae.AAC.4
MCARARPVRPCEHHLPARSQVTSRVNLSTHHAPPPLHTARRSPMCPPGAGRSTTSQMSASRWR